MRLFKFLFNAWLKRSVRNLAFLIVCVLSGMLRNSDGKRQVNNGHDYGYVSVQKI